MKCEAGMTARFTVSLPEEDLARIDELAAEQGVTRSEFVREAAARYIAKSDETAEAARRREAGERFLEHLETWQGLPALDERPTLEILREIRGPLGSDAPWDDGADIP
jgi:Arc/MetJ-type ribon-helix-helix transcriptional regulator